MFLWKARKEINGASCLVVWEKVMRPNNLSGLSIHNLEIMGWALQMCWLWIEKTKQDRLWAGLEVPVHPNMRPFLQFLSSPLLVMDGIPYFGLIDGCKDAAWRTLFQTFSVACLWKYKEQELFLRLCKIILGWEILEKHLAGMVLWSTLTYGIALLPLSSIPLSTLTIGNLKLQGSTLQDQPIKTFLLAPSPSNLGSDFGKLGHLANARLLFGWQFEIAAGQQTGCRKGASLIRSAALFVAKMTRIFNTFLHLVYLHVNSGLVSCSPWI